jgi:hypothetical protein
MIYSFTLILTLTLWVGISGRSIWTKREKLLDDCLFHRLEIKKKANDLKGRNPLSFEEKERSLYLENLELFAQREQELFLDKLETLL